MSRVYLVKDVDSGRFENLLEQQLRERFRRGMVVAVKLHMGQGKGMFSPELTRRVIGMLLKLGCKPFLFDTPVAYPGKRATKEAYEATAVEHGFSEENIGCPVIISDDYVEFNTEHLKVQVSKELVESDAFLVLSHVKGHPACGFGGAIKNIAMGCVSPKSKSEQHKIGIPVVNENCTACGVCKDVCPYRAITIEDVAVVNKDGCWSCSTCVLNCPQDAITSKTSFDGVMADVVHAVIEGLSGKPIFFVSDVRSITLNCDCFSNPGKIIAKDVGVLLSSDIIAVDKASVDLVKEQEGNDVFFDKHHHDPYIQVRMAEKKGIGSSDYALEKR